MFNDAVNDFEIYRMCLLAPSLLMLRDYFLLSYDIEQPTFALDESFLRKKQPFPIFSQVNANNKGS